MNKDQLLSLVRTALKLAAGALIAHGLTQTGGWLNAEDTLGAALGIAATIWSIKHHSESPDTPTK